MNFLNNYLKVFTNPKELSLPHLYEAFDFVDLLKF